MTSLMSSLLRRAGNAVQSGFAVIGLAASAAGYMEYKRLFPDEDKKLSPEGNKDATSKSSSKVNRVLVIPFHRMQLVEQKESSLKSFLNSLDRDEGDDVTPYEVRELVDVLHHAAADPTITAVYGVFGHGGTGMEEAGWAQLEEVRNALQVVKESHRRHADPNVTHKDPSEVVMPIVPHKPLYAYTDNFASFGSPSNKDYYLASIFTHIHLQEKGELNLFGMLTQQFFVRGLLEKYGIQLHVFKHGPYKNAPNMFTHQTFNKFHLDNVTNILTSINNDVCEDITRSRFKALSCASWLLANKTKVPHHKDKEVAYKSILSSMWLRIRETGTFPGDAAYKAGLVDFLPSRDPLLDLVQYNVDKEDRESATDTDGGDEAAVFPLKLGETCTDGFPSAHKVTLKDYAKSIAAQNKASRRISSWREYSNQVLTMSGLKSVIPVTQPPKETIALLHVDGGIDDAMANKMVDSIRKIRHDSDTKCVVVRVSSPGGSIFACETIQQELKALNVPVVVSFGNVSASGGYYISAAADRIFSGKKTITGSIGVFGIRADLTGLAAMYGINVEHVATGEYSGSYAPFHPMSKKMKANMSEQIDRYYAQFKQIVADGRNMPLEKVEEFAQGRVWTGDQAKSSGLIDELGGLHRALWYARRTYTSNTKDVDDWSDVVVWPKKKSLLEKLAEAKKSSDASKVLALLYEWATGNDMSRESIASVETQQQPNNLGALGKLGSILQFDPTNLPPTLSGIMMTVDEDTAIRCLLGNARPKRTQETDWK